eukprot:scaffold194845_cov21-Tisochrysis_lutea.AAC.1
MSRWACTLGVTMPLHFMLMATHGHWWAPKLVSSLCSSPTWLAQCIASAALPRFHDYGWMNGSNQNKTPKPDTCAPAPWVVTLQTL